MLSDDFLRLPLDRIVVNRDDRQRRSIYDKDGLFINSDGLLESVASRGVINPVIITRNFVLVAGERRLEASRCSGRKDIPVRFVEDLSEPEAKVLELEENLKRSDLPWRDEVAALAQLHGLYRMANPSHTVADTVRITGHSQIKEALRVARDLESPRIASATSVRQAYNVLARLDERATADAVSDIIEADSFVFAGADAGAARAGGASDADPMFGAATGAERADGHATGTTADPAARAPSDDIAASLILANFHEWAASYTGPRFNLLHCDFPYGVNVFGGRWGDTAGGQQRYVDTAEEYWSLVKTLCQHLDRIMSHSGHLVFWLTADVAVQWKTLEAFRELAPDLIFWPKPLIWLKTDNLGIMADPRRGPRHVYETALVASRSDRLVAKPVSDAYGAPTDKSYHPSTKPEPVLRFFFQMFVDEHTMLFDPTCGSGSALRAAESLGAKRVLGLEQDAEHLKSAQTALRTFRTLRRVAK